MVFLRKSFHILFLLFILSSSVFAQNIRLSGTIIDLETHQPVPLVNVFTTDRRFGTISNDRGVFSLNIPDSKVNTYLHFSSMNFEPDSVLISRTGMPERIFLISTSLVLSEVVIMPDDALLALLRRAYERIPENFSNHPVLYTGFLQHSRSNPEGELIALAEAELSVFKEAYHRTGASGQVEILQSRIIQLQPARGFFVGGAFIALEGDIVLQRSSFIAPRNFRYFNYTFLGATSWRGRPVYKIQFEPRQMDFGSMQGSMLIDRETLAYVSFEITRENPCAVSQVLGILPPAWSHQQVVYEQHNGTWHLMHVISRMRHENFRFREPLYSSVDFITTYIQTENVQPIPPDRRLGRMDPIETTTERFSAEDGWTDFDVVDDEDLEQTGFQFSTIEAYRIFHQDVEDVYYNPMTAAVHRFMSRLVWGYGLQYKPHYSHLTFHSVIGFRLNRQWSIQYRPVGSFYDNRITLEQIGLGVEWRRNLGQSSNSPFFGASLWVSNNTFEQMLHERFRYQTITPQISLSRRATRGRGGFGVFVNYPIIIRSNIEMDRRRLPNVGVTLYLL